MNPEEPGSESWMQHELEVRLVALIAGEASAFERAELERLMEEDPELKVFYRRMKAVNDLMAGESQGSAADAQWRLSPERRHAVLAMLGAGEAASSGSRARPAGGRRRRFIQLGGWAAAAAVMLCGLGLFSLRLGSDRFDSVGMVSQAPPAEEAESSFDPMSSFSLGEDLGSVLFGASGGATSWSEPAPPLADTKAENDPRPSAEPMADASPPSAPEDGYAMLDSGDGDFGQISGINMRGRRGLDPSMPEVALNEKAAVEWDFGIEGIRPSLESRLAKRSQAFGVNQGADDFFSRSLDRDVDEQGTDGVAGNHFFAYESKLRAEKAPDVLREQLAGAEVGGRKLVEQVEKVEEARLEMLDLAERYRIVDLAALADKPAQTEAADGAAEVAQLKTHLEEGTKDNTVDERRKIARYSEVSRRYEAERKTLQRMNEAAAAPQDRTDLALSVAPPAEPELEEKQAAQEPFSTFSLHVSDVAFKLAKAALLDNGTAPEAAKMRVEEFVNAFDYGDRVPAYDEQVACTVEQAAHPFLQQRNLLRISMRTAALGRAASQPLRLTLLLDNSGSMEREDRKASVLQAVTHLADQLTAQDRVNLVSFARQPQLRVEALPGDQAASLVQAVARTPVEGGTNLELALQLGGELARRHFVAQGQNRVVILTDGAANLGDADPERLRALTRQLREDGIAVDACGVGANGLNDRMLEALTREADGRYYFLDRAEDADASFVQQVAGSLRPAARNVKVQVRFDPARVGSYRLLGFEKHRLAKEDFRNDAVDAAELGGAEAGVALYQVEVKPEGEGPLGEVFVRYQEMASGRMVERRWEIPYEERVAGFAEAAPSLQLAGVAAFVGQRLQGGPAGEQVRLGELSGVLANLRQAYGEDPRVKDLVAMAEKLR